MDYKEKVIALLNSQELSKEQKEKLENIFPELKESEDERMKKAIMYVLYENYTDAAVIEGVEIAEIIAWLEKQSEQTHVELGHSEVTKTSDQELEPKFKVGDWVVKQNGKNFWNGDCIAQITNITDCGEYWLNVDCWVEARDIRLWTINDARDGDVLVDSYSKDSIIILYKGIDKERSILAHCGWNGYNFSIKTNGLGYGGLDNTNYLPATKEQRDLLFSKMKQEGYEWNAEKKELKKKISGEFTDSAYENFWDSIKTEHKMLDANKVIEWLRQHICATCWDKPDETISLRIEKFKEDFGL